MVVLGAAGEEDEPSDARRDSEATAQIGGAVLLAVEPGVVRVVPLRWRRVDKGRVTADERLVSGESPSARFEEATARFEEAGLKVKCSWPPASKEGRDTRRLKFVQ